MPKIIDSFMFFQELDLLEIRLKYLNKYVDKFVIVEACQTHSGKPKEFVFEKNKQRFKNFLHKIEYYKIKDMHFSYDSVIKYLKNINTNLSLFIADNFHKRTQLDKNHPSYLPVHLLSWTLDNYQRECILFPLEKIAKSDDIILLSDLDEIPHYSIFRKISIQKAKIKPQACLQHEFTYFLNCYKNSDWIGTIVGTYKDMTKHPLNILRVDRLFFKKIIDRRLIKNGGYHFTTVGTMQEILNKIESYGHQELNNNIVKNNLFKNIKAGSDLYSRDNKKIFNRIDLNKNKIFDKTMLSIIKNYNHLINSEDVTIYKKINKFERIYGRIYINFSTRLFHLKSKIKYMIKKKFFN